MNNEKGIKKQKGEEMFRSSKNDSQEGKKLKWYFGLQR